MKTKAASAALALCLALALLPALTLPVSATQYDNSAWASLCGTWVAPGDDVIELTQNVTGNLRVPAGVTALTIRGGGHTITGAIDCASTIHLTLEDVTVNYPMGGPGIQLAGADSRLTVPSGADVTVTGGSGMVIAGGRVEVDGALTVQGRLGSGLWARENGLTLAGGGRASFTGGTAYYDHSGQAGLDTQSDLVLDFTGELTLQGGSGRSNYHNVGPGIHVRYAQTTLTLASAPRSLTIAPGSTGIPSPLVKISDWDNVVDHTGTDLKAWLMANNDKYAGQALSWERPPDPIDNSDASGGSGTAALTFWRQPPAPKTVVEAAWDDGLMEIPAVAPWLLTELSADGAPLLEPLIPGEDYSLYLGGGGGTVVALTPAGREKCRGAAGLTAQFASHRAAVKF